MQTCQNCLLQHYNGTLFCTDCGADLLRQKPAAPAQLLLHENAAIHAAADCADDDGETTRTVSPTHEVQHTGPLVSLVLHDGQHVTLAANRRLLIGRKNKNSNESDTPDVDLGPYDGYTAGVSRRHAHIAWRHDGYVLEDLKSLNGTFVNNTRLSPGETVAINDGDYVQFGTLRAQFHTGNTTQAASTHMRAA